MSESHHSRLMRWRLNFFPAFRRTGARVTYIAASLREIHLELPLNWKTRNYVGTLFGGSMFAAVDPVYMVMYIRLLGRDYIVWDKSATIRYRQPGRSKLEARFEITETELESVRRELEHLESLERTYEIDLIDQSGMVCATVQKILYFRKKAKH